MSPAQSQEQRRAVDYRSVDSQPPGLSVPVSPFRVPALMLTFCLLALFQLWLFGEGVLDWVFPQRDYVFAPYSGQHSIAVRTYIISFYIAFALFASGTPKARLLFGLDIILRFLVICALLDVSDTIFMAIFGAPAELTIVQIAAGIIGFGLFSIMLMERGAMPEPINIKSLAQNNLRMILRLLAVGTIAGFLSAFIGYSQSPIIDSLREITLLGGIGPGVLLFLPLFFLQLYIIGVIERRLMAEADFSCPVTVIVPAFNEEHIIAETIRHIDEAAVYFGEPVELLVLDNNSADGTAEAARRAIAETTAIDGRVIHIAERGKSNALNRGVAEATHPLLMRVDADTQIGEDNIELAVQNFGDPEVGVVGGIPIPPGGGKFDRARLVEVLVKHGYYSPALGALWGLVGVPGMLAVYRTDALRKVGPFATGINGEDTDMSLRIGELGLRAMVDFRVEYVSEVPVTFAHMREQRLRWFRSVYHVSSRCLPIIIGKSQSIRGKLILPYMLLNSARRAMMVPILFFGIFDLLTDTTSDNALVWQSIIAVLVGAPALVAIAAILINRRPSALLALPEYLAFRAMRAWFTLESVLTIRITKNSVRASDALANSRKAGAA
ncbi:glycosyltransferase family 2 protein [Altererythrobacter sp. ZODW24]|uniref:glycosyltransferase n=1 Tax=Altererythrobacter sp. ZODW24 TaxID=2185142 RepID=UPI000DF81013|nr:glycosyltransferase family 2 protein [Altererythrobacter sp. ZODW24]